MIAEEVDKVYLELVIRDEAGKIHGVRYYELAPMLFNEMQLEREGTSPSINAWAAEIRDVKQQQKQFATQSEVNDRKQ